MKVMNENLPDLLIAFPRSIVEVGASGWHFIRRLATEAVLAALTDQVLAPLPPDAIPTRPLTWPDTARTTPSGHILQVTSAAQRYPYRAIDSIWRWIATPVGTGPLLDYSPHRNRSPATSASG